MASTKASSVSLLSVSVGSIMSASGTMPGKYIVGGWMPRSMSPLAMSRALTPFFACGAAERTNSCMHRRSNGTL